MMKILEKIKASFDALALAFLTRGRSCKMRFVKKEKNKDTINK